MLQYWMGNFDLITPFFLSVRIYHKKFAFVTGKSIFSKYVIDCKKILTNQKVFSLERWTENGLNGKNTGVKKKKTNTEKYTVCNILHILILKIK